uniref:Uncharacterized protein n=1 Tax=Arundo donax TaxID=35708 RepID=A0A0A8XYR1_ARUDO
MNRTSSKSCMNGRKYLRVFLFPISSCTAYVPRPLGLIFCCWATTGEAKTASQGTRCRAQDNTFLATENTTYNITAARSFLDARILRLILIPCVLMKCRIDCTTSTTNVQAPTSTILAASFGPPTLLSSFMSNLM